MQNHPCNSAVFPANLADTERAIAREPQGFVSSRRVRVCSFGLMVFAIVAGVVGGLLVVWDVATQESFWRLMASLALVIGGVAAFAMVNTMFGTRPSPPSA
jgi:hypothetical protein